MNNGRVEYIFLWHIENYSYSWHKKGEKLVSPYFTTHGLDDTEWVLKLFPKGCNEARRGSISLFLTRSRADNGPEKVSCSCKLTLLTQEGIINCSKEEKSTFKKGLTYAYANFFSTDYVSWRRRINSASKDTLTVSCNISKAEGDVGKVFTISARTRIGIENISFHHLVQNFSTFKPNQTNTLIIRSRKNKELIISCCVYLNHDPLKNEEVIVEIKPVNGSHAIWKRQISLIGSHFEKTPCSGHDYRFDAKRCSNKLPLILTRQEILAEKSKYLFNGKLCLTCDCTFSTGLELEEIHQETTFGAVTFKNKTL